MPAFNDLILGQFNGIRLLYSKRLFSMRRQVKLPNAERAFIEIAKLRDYSLSPQHKEGRHKARVFASALGLDASDAEWLAERLKEAGAGMPTRKEYALWAAVPA